MKVKIGFLTEKLKEESGGGKYDPIEMLSGAKILEWLKKPGDKIKEGDILITIETDKVTREFESPASGVLVSINYEESEVWQYGGEENTPLGEILLNELCIIEIDGEDTDPDGDSSEGTASPDTETTEEKAEEALEEQVSRENGGEAPEASSPKLTDTTLKSRFTPLAWNIMVNKGLDPEILLDAFVGKGKIRKNFVESFAGGDEQAAVNGGIIPAVPAARRVMQNEGIDPASVEHRGELITIEDIERHKHKAGKGTAQMQADRVLLGASQLRKTVARLLTRSWREIPHAGDTVSINVSRLKEFREKHKGVWRAVVGSPLRYDHFFMFLAARYLTLDEFKILNAYWDEEDQDAFLFNDVNLGVAVQTPAGLMVPVVHGAQKLTFVELVKAAEEKVSKALAGKTAIPDLRDLTFTVNNPGVAGGENPNTVIPYAVEAGGKERPTGMIVALGKMTYDPTRTGWFMPVAFRFDHRLVDGVPAIRFIMAIKEYIESKQKPEEFEELLYENFEINTQKAS